MTPVFPFSKKQGHKWLAGILLTEVWASDWIPPRLGTEREIGGPLGSRTTSSVRNAGQSPACDCPPVRTRTHADDTQTHADTRHTQPGLTHRGTRRQTQTHPGPQPAGQPDDRHRNTQRHILLHTDADRQSSRPAALCPMGQCQLAEPARLSSFGIHTENIHIRQQKENADRQESKGRAGRGEVTG